MGCDGTGCDGTGCDGTGCDGTGCDGTGCDGTGCDGTGVMARLHMPYVDVYDTRLATRNPGASIRRPVVMRESQMGSHTRSVARNVLAVIGT
jgi:hypothetical protein